jgi:CheY-like chemotaxis protein
MPTVIDPAYGPFGPPAELPTLALPRPVWEPAGEEGLVGQTRVLIAEDAPAVRHALADLLASEPSVDLVGVAEDAVEAIELARLERPDLVLIDVKMPGGGGARAVREILHYSPATLVLALSAHADESTVLEMLAAGAVDYILKGAPAGEILSAIAQWRPPAPEWRNPRFPVGQ